MKPSNSADLSNLPPALDLPAAAVLLGISRTAAYELVRSDTWPTPVLRLGHRIKIPTQPLLALLGLSTIAAETVTTTRAPQAG
jgi:predicted DNA-binding transcriptional regulator AlpA